MSLPRCVLLALLAATEAFAQPACDKAFVFRSEIPSTTFEMTMTMKHDTRAGASDRTFLYVANKEGGLKVYDVANVSSPALVATIPITSLMGLHVMNLEQAGNYLYLALGNHFTNSQSPGMAIVDVTDPRAPAITDMWQLDAPDGGAGIVKVVDRHAYLGAMKHGVVILDVGDPRNIIYRRIITPDINYPSANPNPDLYNARGMAVRDSVIFLCYDAGGIRVINVANPSAPRETGRFSNPLLDNLPRAYNNIVLDGDLAYVAVDYCGVEVLDISDTSNIRLVGWWNPYNCPTNNWFTSPVHANEIELDKENRVLFVSTGKSDLYALSITDPLRPDSCGIHGGVDNGIGSWGVSVHGNLVFVSYVIAFIPFSSNWTGVKILEYDRFHLGAPVVQRSALRLQLSRDGRLLTLTDDRLRGHRIRSIGVFDLRGERNSSAAVLTSATSTTIDTTPLPSGTYILHVTTANDAYEARFTKVAR